MSRFPKSLTAILALRDRAKLLWLALAIGVMLVAPRGGSAEEAPVVVRKPVLNRVPRDLADLRGMQTHVQKLAEQVLPATVAVQVGSSMSATSMVCNWPSPAISTVTTVVPVPL